MDETKGKAQDTSHSGDSSGGAGGSTSTPATFTETQVQQMTQKAVNDALAKAGRDAKSLEQKAKAVQEAQAKVDEWKREQDEAETEKYREDPDGLKVLQEKRKNRQERDEIARLRKEAEDERTANAERLARADELELEVSVWKAAQAKGIDASTLKEKCVKFKLNTEEQINDMADTLAAGKPSAGDQLHVDSGRGSGGGGKDYSQISFQAGAPTAQEMISKGLNKK